MTRGLVMVSVTIRCRKDHLGPQSCHELVSLTTTTLPGNTSKIFRPSMAVGLWFWLCEYSTLLFGTPWVGLLERDEQDEHSATTVPAASSTNAATLVSRLRRRALRNATSPSPKSHRTRDDLVSPEPRLSVFRLPQPQQLWRGVVW